MPRKATEFTETYIKNLYAEDKVYVRSERGLVMRVYPSETKSWSVYKTAPNGVRKELKIGNYPDINLKDARAIATKLTGEMIREGHDIASEKKGIKFGEYMTSKSYLNWSKANRKSHTSIMKNLTNVVPSWMHTKPLNIFTNKDFQKFVDERLSDDITEQTINRNLNNIRSVFRHAFLENEIKINPMERFKNLKEKEVSSKRSLTADERRRLITTARDKTLNQAHKRLYMEFFIEIGIATGLRKGELHAIKWKHFKNDDIKTIELEDKIIGNYFKDDVRRMFQTVGKTITHLKLDSTKNSKLPVEIDYKEKDKLRWYIEVEGSFTKSQKVRTVPVPNHLIERLRRYLWDRELNNIIKKYPDALAPDENMNIIRANNPTAMSYLEEVDIIPVADCKRAFSTIHKNAGLPSDVTIHTMRHEFCSNLIRQNIDIYTVQRLAGHADIRTTMIYLHNLDSKDFSKLDKLEHNLIG